MPRTSWRLVAALMLLATAACRPEFQLKNYTSSNEALYSASINEYRRRHWDNAVTGFEKLTTDLPARDTLLPRSYWYLASSHKNLDEFLLAAQSFSRLVESFPDDTLADDAAYEAARSYRRLWRKPGLDPTNGETALASYQTLIGLYPTSPLVASAQKDIAELEEWFAKKDLAAGMYYFRRKAYDSAILYLKNVVTKYANAPSAREAAVKLAEAYKASQYREDVSELCTQLRQRYPKDREVSDVCKGVPDMPSVKPDSVPPIKPPPAR